MAYKEIEVILSRQLASSLATPVFIVDPHGTLVYYNEPAEGILGHRFEETGEVPLAEWSTVYAATDELGEPIPPSKLPLVVALTVKRPAHMGFWIMGRDNVRRHIEVTAFPLLAQADTSLGAIAIFWEDRAR